MTIHLPGKQTKRHLPQSGFSLIEIMVGLVIGLLASLVVVRVFTFYEAQRGKTIGAADTQVNGNIAFFSVTRRLQMAGYGMMPAGKTTEGTTAMLECQNLVYKDISVSGIVPVVLTDGVSDTLTVRYGTAKTGGSYVTLNEAPVGNKLQLISNFGCEKNDIAYISYMGNCAMAKIKEDVVAPTPLEPRSFLDLVDDQAMQKGVAVKGARLACLGKWIEIAYSVNNNRLMGNAEAIAPEIVNIQAQYGISASPTSNTVTAWVDPTGAWAAPTVDDRKLIKAIHIAFVARNPQRNADVVTQPCSSLTAPNPTGLCAWTGSTTSPAPFIDLSADPDYGHYRYEVFEAIIPLRNVIWANSSF